MNLFEKSLKYNGYDIAFAKAELKRIQQTPEREFEKYVDSQKIHILTHHFMYNPFYRELLGTEKVPDWEDVPVLTKAHLQRPLSERLAEGYRLADVYQGKTSGSSGHPFTFAKCKSSHALSWASFYDRYSWYDIDLSGSKQARFYGIPLNSIGYYKERFKDWLGNRYRFPIFDLSDGKLAGILLKFRNESFEYINGYTSSIVLFAKYLRKKEQLLKDVCPTLKMCIVTSEMLFDDDRRLLETQFKIPVINEYGASETGLIAFQNREGQLHVDSELLHIEVLDENGENVPNGNVGRIVITALYNKAHPIIRYEIGDMGALSTQSTPAKPILEKLQGRTNDIARLPSGKVVPGLTFYYVTKTVIEDDGNVSEFVIHQRSEKQFDITYVAAQPLTSQQEHEVRKATATYLEEGLDIIFHHVEKLQRSESGKLKQFVNCVGQ